MHKLLERQLIKCFGGPEGAPATVQAFLEVVERAYEAADHDRALLERSMDLVSEELMVANSTLREDRDVLARRVAEHTQELLLANRALEREIGVRERATTAIRQSEKKYRSLFEESLDPILIVARDGVILDLNQAAVKGLGLDSKADGIGASVIQFYSQPQDRVGFVADLEADGFVAGREIEVLSRDGRKMTVQASSVAVRDDAGEMTAIRTTLRDVTRERAMQRELLQSQKIEAVGRLAGGVAHEFNNLLTAVHGSAEILLHDLEAESEHHELAIEIRDAARRGAELTERLLAFGRRQVVSEQRLDLNELISGVEGLLRCLVGSSTQLTTDLSASHPMILGDVAQIEQILVNLTLNAPDAMPDGGEVTLSTAVRDIEEPERWGRSEIDPGRWVQMTVLDTGTGIDQGILEFIFDPFFTTKAEAGGNGLGLAAVHGIVQQSKGHVRVASDAGQGAGATFQILWPWAGPTPDLPADPDAAASSADLDPAVASKTLALVVDDDASVRLLTCRLLNKQGYRTVEAASGRDALDRFSDGVDLLVTDIVMPQMQGPELAAKLRERVPTLPVLLMSGYAGTRTELERQGLPEGMRFLRKPFRGQELLAAVRALVTERP